MLSDNFLKGGFFMKIKKKITGLSLAIAIVAATATTSFAASGSGSFGTLSNAHSSSSTSFTATGKKNLAAKLSGTPGGATLYVTSSSNPLAHTIIITGLNDSPSSAKYSSTPKKGSTVRVTAKLGGATSKTHVSASAYEY